MKAAHVAALTIAVMATINPREGRAFCLYNPGYNWRLATNEFGVNYTRIPVVIHPNLHNRLRKPNGTLWTKEEVRHEIEWVLEAFNTYSSSNMPPLFVEGESTAGEDSFQPYKLHITSYPVCGAVGYTNGTPGAQGVKVAVQWSDCASMRWVHAENPPTSAYALRGVLMHELGHALGLNHPDSCGPVAACQPAGFHCRVMEGTISGLTSADNQNLLVDDVLGIVDKYGAYPTYGNLVHEYSPSGGNPWSVLPAPPVALQPHFSLSSSSSFVMTLANRDSLSSPCAYVYEWFTSQWTSWGCATQSQTNGPLGVAQGLYNWVYFLNGETQNTSTKNIGMLRYAAPGSIITYVDSAELTRRNGISATEDPKSGTRIVAYRNSNDELRIRVHTGTAGVFQASLAITSQGSPVVAYGPPSIACGDASIDKNCILVWASAATGSEQLHVLRWMHFKLVSQSGVWKLPYGSQSAILTVPYLMFSPPQVAYRGPANASRAFVVTWMVPGCLWYTLGKTSSENALFTGEDGHVANCNGVTQPAVGSVANWAELLNTYW